MKNYNETKYSYFLQPETMLSKLAIYKKNSIARVYSVWVRDNTPFKLDETDEDSELAYTCYFAGFSLLTKEDNQNKDMVKKHLLSQYEPTDEFEYITEIICESDFQDIMLTGIENITTLEDAIKVLQ